MKTCTKDVNLIQLQKRNGWCLKADDGQTVSWGFSFYCAFCYVLFSAVDVCHYSLCVMGFIYFSAFGQDSYVRSFKFIASSKREPHWFEVVCVVVDEIYCIRD